MRACFQASAVRNSPPRGSVGAICFTARYKSFSEKYWNIGSRIQLVMKTSRRQIFQGGEDTLTCSQGDSHVSRSALQASERERKITATSGRKCYEQYGRYSPLGSLVKTLLESSQWYSPARRLRWDARTLCSKRITYTERSISSPSMPSVKTLSMRDMPSSRFVIPACAVGAPHRRDRVWIVARLNADTDCQRCAGRSCQTQKRGTASEWAGIFRDIERPCGGQDAANSANARTESVQQGRKDGISEFRITSNTQSAGSKRKLLGQQAQVQSDRQNCRIDKPDFADFPTQSPICSRNDGLPFRLADLTISFAKWRSKSIEALGNSWVPQVTYEIFKAIENYDKMHKL